MTREVFHAGEQAVQRRAGVQDAAAKLGAQMISPTIDPDLADFLAEQPFVVAASSDPAGHVWASPLSGPPGFAHAIAADQLAIETPLDPADPLATALAAGPTPVGLVVLEPMSRSRIRLNGTAHSSPDGLRVQLREVFGNCPKYIQRRYPRALTDPDTPAGGRISDRLDNGQRALLASADTFFVASRHRERGDDASHRGGRPGFVQVATDGRSLTFPDYQGNNMFQTLGNLSVDPAIGLLFIGWDTGRTVQLTGSAQIVWDDSRLAAWPKAQRLVDVSLAQIIDRPSGSPFRWELVEAHRLNPEVPSGSPRTCS
ncbi:MAG: pyridoxamine 5'-phosphate oxidase family protein [Solirubrobacterales bacterium]|nr:pyridoxamine 5'-phosphate oxidase family protein [Solirubrobacterales bacterium]